MTGPQPGVGSPIVQTPTLRPTDVVREPGLDQTSGEQLPALARLLMAKGQLALEQEKFQNEMAQQKQKKQTLDQLGTQLSGLFQGITPQQLPGAMGKAAGAFGAAGEPGAAAAALGHVPAAMGQAQAASTRSALGAVLNEFTSQDVRNPAVQAELLMHTAVIDPEAAFRISEGLKNLADPGTQFTPFLGNDGGIYIVNHRDGSIRKAADTGQKNAPNQQQSRIGAAQAAQALADIEAIASKAPNALTVPVGAAMLEGAKTGGGALGAIAGALEPLAKGQYTPEQLQVRRLKLNFIDHYAAAIIGRRAAGSPATMKLVMDGFFPAAGENDPKVQASAAALRARTRQLLADMARGKTVDLSTLPGYGSLLQDAQIIPPAGGAMAPQSGGAAPVSFDNLLKGVPK